METNYSPQDALADIDSSNAAIADRLVTPVWYHPVLGLCVAGLCLAAGQVVASKTLPLIASAAVLMICLLLMNVYRRRTGIWVGPAQSGPRSRPLWLATTVIMVVAVAASAAAAGTAAQAWVPWVAAAVALVAMIVLGRAVDSALRDEIRAGTATVTR